MSGPSHSSPHLVRSTFLSSSRKDVLWNVVEPGDPYDIRKSMIAKLPGKKTHFMGSNLEVVCLLQSAEIQRLCEFLEDYKYRYKEIERRELDRHSYQVQIKELTQQLQDEESFTSENVKLKEFIKKQTVIFELQKMELEELRISRREIDMDLRSKYEASLQRIESLLAENERYKLEMESFLIQINNFNAKFQAVERAKNKEIEELLFRVNEESRYSIQFQTNAIKTKYETEISRLEYEVKRLKEFNEAKNQQITQISAKNRSLLIEIQEISSKKSQASYYERKIEEYEQRFLSFGQEIEKLNIRLKESATRLDESSRNELLWRQRQSRLERELRESEDKYRRINQQYSAIELTITKLQEEKVKMSMDFSKEEVTIKQLNMEIERLNERLKFSENEKNKLNSELSKVSYELNRVTIVERENQQMRKSLTTFESDKRKIAEFQNKIALFSQQIERLTLLLKNAEVDKESYNKLRIQYEESRRMTQNLEFNLTQKYEREIQQIRTDYEEKIFKINQTTGTEYQNKINTISRQMELLNNYLKQRTQESENYKRRIHELETMIQQKYEIETSRKITQFEATIREAHFENEQLQRKVSELSETQRRLMQYENKLALAAQQIQRLNLSLRSKNEECESVKIRYRELENKVTNIYEVESNRRFTNYEQTISNLNRENDDMKRKLNQLVEANRRLAQFENKFAIMTQEIERLNQVLRSKVEEMNQLQNKNRNLSMELENANRVRVELENSTNYRMEMQKMQTSRKVSTFEQNITFLQRENEEVKRRNQELSQKLAQYENKIVLIGQEIEKLSQILRGKDNQISQNETMIRNLTNELEGRQKEIIHLRTEFQTIRKQYKEYQVSVTQKYEFESKKTITTYEQNMGNLTRELEEYKRRTVEFENAFRKMEAEIERLNNVIKGKSEQVGQYDQRYRSLTQEYEMIARTFKEYQLSVNSKFENEVNRNYSNYEQSIKQLARENEELKRKIAQSENKVAVLSQENERVNQNLRSSHQEIENFKRKIMEIENLITQKYEVEVGRKISTYEQNINTLKRENDELNRKIIQLQNINNHSLRENEELRRRLNDLSDLNRKIVELQNLIISVKTENERLKGELQQSQSRNQQLSMESENWRKRFTELEITVTQKYEVETTRKINLYEQNINNLNKDVENLNRRLGEYEVIKQNYEQEINRLNNMLANLKQENQKSVVKVRELETAITQKYEIETSRKISTFEQNISSLNRENEELKRRVSQYQQNTSAMNRDNEELRRKIQQINRVIAEFENKVALLKQENQRLNNGLRGKVQEVNQLQANLKRSQQEIENLKRQVKDVEVNIVNKYEYEINRKVSTFEQNTLVISRENDDLKRKIAELENRSAIMKQQIQRLKEQNQNFRSKLTQMESVLQNTYYERDQLTSKLHQLEVSSSKRIENQRSRVTTNYEQRINTMSRENEDSRRQLTRKISQYETRMPVVTQEIERLNQTLKIKVEEIYGYEKKIQELVQQNGNLKRQLKEQEYTYTQKYEVEVSRKYQTYEQTITTIKNEQEGMKRTIVEYENRIAIMIQQIQRLNQTLKGKIQEIAHYQNECKQYQIQIQHFKTNVSAHFSSQIEKLTQLINQKNEENQKVNREYQLLQQRLSEIQSSRESQYKKLEASYGLVTKEYENSKKHLVEYEQSIKKLYSEFQRLQVIIDQLKKERKSLFEKNQGLINEIQRLNVQHKSHEEQILQLRLKLSDDVSLQKRISEHMALMVVLFAEVQTLRMRVKDKEKEVQEVRRSSLAPFKAVESKLG